MKKQILFILLVLCFFTLPVFAQEELFFEVDPDEPVVESPFTPFIYESASSEDVELPVYSDEELDQADGFWQLWESERDKAREFQEKLQPLSLEVLSMTGQLQLLQVQMERFQREVSGMVEERSRIQDELSKLNIQKKLKKLDLQEDVQRVNSVVRLLYKVKRGYIDIDGKINLYRLFFQEGKVSDTLLKERLLDQVQADAVHILKNSLDQFAYLSYLEKSLLDYERRLQIVVEQADRVRTSLAEQYRYQQELVSRKESEKEFIARQLEEALRDQQRAYDVIQEIAARSRGYESSDRLGVGDEEMIWPVSPGQGISAHYRDGSYRKRFGLEHNAVDIPTPHYSAVYAPLSGKVEKVHDAGMGYNYLQLVHDGGLSTVYGHVAEFKVKEGDLVRQGDVIALSGGSPGTKGAGLLTTGAHLHFEVLDGGVWKDPQNYLPRR